MSYLVLARKYRPQTFEAVVAQEHVTRTLTNAIRAERVAHAILFTGPRGTGKTTIARILAKAMNCENGPTPAPCNTCRSCTDIVAGSSADVFEIDGASNNGVEQIRDLRDNIRYLPAHSRHKIYIIDEVHMLSIGAFNALLKTLEEPPAHVMFFFATTEPNKIPVTILSRCQRHDLRRIDSGELVAHMKQLCQEEDRDVSAQSLALIAREAGGSMRDALSLLDQVLASTDGKITPDTVLTMVGGVDHDLVARMAAGLLQRDTAALISFLEDAYTRGVDLKKLYADLVAYFRDIMVVAIGKNNASGGGDLPLLDAGAADREALDRAASLLDLPALQQMFRLLYDNGTAVRLAPDTRLAIEMVVFQAGQIVPSVSVDTLIAKLDQLREAAGMTPAPDAGHGAPARPATRRDPPPASDTPSPAHGQAPAAPTAPPQPPAAQPPGSEPAPADDTQHDGPEIPGSERARDAAWSGCLDAMSRKHPSLAAQLRESRLTRMDTGSMDVAMVGNGFHLNMVKRPKNREALQSFCSEYFRRPMTVSVTGAAQAGTAPDQKKKRAQDLRQEILAHPLVEDAMNIFDGQLVNVKILEEDDS